MDRFEGMTDEQLVKLAVSQGDVAAETYLLNKYKNLVRAKARSYFLVGADHEDIIQEGMIGLFKGIRDYDETKSASFRVFADLCITRQIITAVKTATRQKHMPLNSYVSLSKPVYGEEGERTLQDMIASGTEEDPELLFIGQEETLQVEKSIAQQLSEFEMQVLERYLDGCSYQQIAQRLGRTGKAVDNALQRIKHKMEKLLDDGKTETLRQNKKIPRGKVDKG